MPDVSLVQLPAQIAMALSLASSSTGTDLDYLMRTAERESSFQADAKAATSSAEGLFQFIEETWIRTVKDEGARYGLADYAAMIEKREDGRYVVADPANRRAILALRRDPHVSAMMAAAYARRNAAMIAEEIGRQPTSAELYIAHFLGPSDAVRLIKLRDTRRYLSAPDLFPKAAASNERLFYADGKPRSVGQVYDVLVSRHERTVGRIPASPAGGVDAGFGSWDPRVQQVVYLTGSAAAQARHVRNGSAEPVEAAGSWAAEIVAGAGTPVAAMPIVLAADDTDAAADPGDAPETSDPDEPEPQEALRGSGETHSQGTRRISVADALNGLSTSTSLKIIRVSK